MGEVMVGLRVLREEEWYTAIGDKVFPTYD